ncbi:Hypothetical_protein [Hexamita inflata]|uniref:Hypothetical_protein n=1 Tax=Hexamita inflata TaxID=28002 RepID=A0ABP1L340_9EUKA
MNAQKLQVLRNAEQTSIFAGVNEEAVYFYAVIVQFLNELQAVEDELLFRSEFRSCYFLLPESYFFESFQQRQLSTLNGSTKTIPKSFPQINQQYEQMKTYYQHRQSILSIIVPMLQNLCIHYKNRHSSLRKASDYQKIRYILKLQMIKIHCHSILLQI